MKHNLNALRSHKCSFWETKLATFWNNASFDVKDSFYKFFKQHSLFESLFDKQCLFQKNPLRPCTYISFLAKECCSSLTLSGLPHREMESFSREVIFSSQETMGILNVEFSNLMKFCGITSQTTKNIWG